MDCFKIPVLYVGTKSGLLLKNSRLQSNHGGKDRKTRMLYDCIPLPAFCEFRSAHSHPIDCCAKTQRSTAGREKRWTGARKKGQQGRKKGQQGREKRSTGARKKGQQGREKKVNRGVEKRWRGGVNKDEQWCVPMGTMKKSVDWTGRWEKVNRSAKRLTGAWKGLTGAWKGLTGVWKRVNRGVKKCEKSMKKG